MRGDGMPLFSVSFSLFLLDAVRMSGASTAYVRGKPALSNAVKGVSVLSNISSCGFTTAVSKSQTWKDLLSGLHSVKCPQ